MSAKPGEMHAVDQAFYDHAVAQRDAAWREADALRAALAASQAREKVLREALPTVVMLAKARAGTRVVAAVQAVEAALAQPADDSALREFGLRVLHGVAWSDNIKRAVVDAVLRGGGR